MTPDDPATPEEQARAARLAALVDGALAGSVPPPVMAAEERALLDTAAKIRAARSLSPARREAVLGTIFARRRRALVPWAVAAMAAAAALLLALRPPTRPPAPPSASALVGRIEGADAGAARARLDVLYADRLAGYRRALLDGRTR